ncbi:TonB-dependent receptor [Ancylobacter sonchi]|uniref:TonB-dependent receptor domain-containing protein n=1 Tax=Ancylobacter sonchi TaxID=1937790 RepID=UPI001BD4D7A0|nr:TonB-dependent receptor [Ancylobacter sonchi]MBS7532629.1 TonB-dependent receptor [Ancylobacter sonchi]
MAATFPRAGASRRPLSRHSALLGISLGALVVAAPALAQQAASTAASTTTATAGEAEALPTVTVQGADGRLVSDPYSTPSAVSTVNMLNNLNQSSRLDTVLRTVPGTFTEQSTSNPGVAINIRGFQGFGRVNMMIDGVRQNFRFVGHEASGFAYVDEQLLAGVDIARGAVSTAGGAGALAGAADMRTLGVDDIIKPGNNWGAISNLTWGSNGVGWKEMFAGAAKLNDRVSVAGAIANSGPTNYENGAGVMVPYTWQNLTSGLLKSDIKLTDDSTLKLGAVFYNNFFYANSADQQVTNNTFTANYHYDPDSELIDFRLNAYYNDLTMTYLNTTRTSSSSRGRVIEDQGWGFDTSNTSKFMWGEVAVSTINGFEYFYDDVSASNSLTPANYGGVNPSGENSIGGVFSETTFSYNIVDFILGLRYDFYTLDGSGYESGTGGAVPIGAWTVDQSDGRFDPKFTLAINPFDWLQPYVTYAETMRAPTASETMVGGTHPGGTGSYSANPYLEPEVSKGWEFGFNIRKDGLFVAGDQLRLKADYFTNDISNYIVTCRNVQYYFCNVDGTSNVSGIELEANYDSGKFFASASYTHNKNDLPPQTQGFGTNQYLPDDIVSLTAGLRFFDERLTIGGRYSFYSESTQITFGPTFVGAISSTPSASYNLVDLFGSYQINDKLTFRVDATNLFDEEYTPALSVGATGFTGYTGQGRTVLMSLRAHF